MVTVSREKVLAMQNPKVNAEITSVDTVMSVPWHETSFTKQTYMKQIKGYKNSKQLRKRQIRKSKTLYIRSC